MKPTVLYIGTDNHNMGDTFVDLGCRYIMQQVIGDHYAVQAMIRHDTDGTHPYEYPPVDYLVVCGTPWLWDGCKESGKYKALKTILDRTHVGEKKIALGLGCCYLLGTTTEWMKRDADAFADLFEGFDLLVYREPLIQEAVTQSRLDHVPQYQMPDPSIYAAKYLQVGRTQPFAYTELVAFLDPYNNPASRYSTLTSEMLFEQLQLQKIEAATSWCFMSQRECEEETNRAHGKIAPDKTLSHLCNAATVYSGRVHACMPALAAGARVCIYPWDTRAATVLCWGGEIWGGMKGPEYDALFNRRREAPEEPSWVLFKDACRVEYYVKLILKDTLRLRAQLSALPM